MISFTATKTEKLFDVHYGTTKCSWKKPLRSRCIACKFQDWGCVELREIDFLFKNLLCRFDCVSFVETNFLNTGIFRSESSQNHERRA